MTETKERLENLLKQKSQYLEKKAKLEASLEIAEKELEELSAKIEELFGTTNLKELKEVRDGLIAEAEEILNNFESNE